MEASQEYHKFGKPAWLNEASEVCWPVRYHTPWVLGSVPRWTQRMKTALLYSNSTVESLTTNCFGNTALLLRDQQASRVKVNEVQSVLVPSCIISCGQDHSTLRVDNTLADQKGLILRYGVVEAQ